MKTLDIIIPQYKEGEKTLNRLLQSINKQKAVNFKRIGIIIINDASDIKLSNKLFKQYPKLKIKYIKNKINVGPGLTRQNGINESEADYITFMDADDMYYDSSILSLVFEAIDNKAPNLILSKWLEENIVGDEIQLIPHESDVIWVHGKFIKREYLVNNNISFSQELRLHEDSYFSTLLMMSTNDIAYINCYGYLWKYDNRSLVRAKRKYAYLVESFDDSLKSIKLLSKELINRKNERAAEYIIKSIFFLMYSLSSYIFNQDDYTRSLKEKYELDILLMYKEYKDLFKQFSPNEIEEFRIRQIKSLEGMISNINSSEGINQYFIRLAIKHKVNL